jgi:hypothetical protein
MKVAYVLAQVACANAEIAGMQAENQLRALSGFLPAYGEKEFVAVIERYTIGHNAVIGYLMSY